MGTGEPAADGEERRSGGSGPVEPGPVDDAATTRSPVPDAQPMRSGEPVPSPREPAGPPDVRVGDADRTAALTALDRHLEDGRITIDEYGDRSAAASVAVTQSDLVRLFADLPAPHPPLPSPPGAEPAEIPRGGPPQRSRRPRPPVAAIALGLAMVAALTIVPMLAAAGIGVHGGIFAIPLLFLVLGRLGHRGRGPHH